MYLARDVTPLAMTAEIYRYLREQAEPASAAQRRLTERTQALGEYAEMQIRTSSPSSSPCSPGPSRRGWSSRSGRSPGPRRSRWRSVCRRTGG
jgi:hypothetical protein